MGKKTLVSKSYFTSVNDHIFIRKEEIRCCSVLASHFIGGVFSLNSSEPEDMKWHNFVKYSIFRSNKTISDGGITVDFSIIKVHTSN